MTKCRKGKGPTILM